MSLSDLGAGVGAWIGNEAGRDHRDKVYNLLQDNYYDWAKIRSEIPTLEEQRIQAEQVGPTGYDQVAVDPRLRQAQMGALSNLQAESNRGGMGVDDLATVRQAEDETDRRSRAARMAVLDHMRATGMSGSGAELAAQLQGEQAAAQTRSAAGLQAAADARKRALASAQATGQLGGQMEGEDTRRQESKAAARDRIAQFNANNRTGANLYNSGLYQTQFGNRVTAQGGVGNARKDIAGNELRESDLMTKQGAAGGAVIGGVGDAFLSAYTGGASEAGNIGKKK